MGGGADVECHKKSSVFKYILFEQWRSQGIHVARGIVQEVKQGVASWDKLKIGGDAKGGDIDLLVGSVSPLHRESFMSYEILNEDKTNFIIDVINERLPL